MVNKYKACQRPRPFLVITQPHTHTHTTRLVKHNRYIHDKVIQIMDVTSTNKFLSRKTTETKARLCGCVFIMINKNRFQQSGPGGVDTRCVSIARSQCGSFLSAIRK